MKRIDAFIVGLLLLLATPLNGAERLTTTMWPFFAIAPGTVRVRATIQAHSDNRAIRIAADSRDFYRSSEIPLNGEHAPRTTVVDLTNLPAGTYQVTAMLIDVQGGMTAMQQFTFVCRGQ